MLPSVTPDATSIAFFTAHTEKSDTATESIPMAALSVACSLLPRHASHSHRKITFDEYFVSGMRKMCFSFDFMFMLFVFASAGWSLSQTESVLRQRAGVCLKQGLFCISGLEFAPNRVCFAPAGWSLSQTGSVLRQRAGVCPKQGLFCVSGLEFVSNRVCFASAGWSLSQTESVLHHRVPAVENQTCFCVPECLRSKIKLVFASQSVCG